MTDRIALVFAKSLGFIFSKIPFPFLEKATEVLAWLLMSIPNSRRRLLVSNLRHAFPNWDYAKILSVAKESSARMFEMGFFSLCYPFMSKDQLRHTVFYDDDTEAKLEELRKTGKPVLMLIPHTCLFETLATSPFFRPFGGRSLGAIYRPNKNSLLDKWITKAREKVGIIPFSRKEGLIRARAHLRKCNWLAVLYDQNAGLRGLGSTFLGRKSSISPLPDLLAKNSDVICAHAIAKRQSFFRSELELDIFNPISGKPSNNAHCFLENKITNCSNGLPEWLWGHGKWKVNDMDHEFFDLQEKFTLTLPQILHRKTSRLIIRMPNWLGDIVMAIPVLKAIRSSRPDFHVTLICKPQYVEWLKSLDVVHVIYPLKRKCSIQYYMQFFKLRISYPDAQLNFTNSLRSDLEALIIGAPKRFGLQGRRRRFLLSKAYNPKCSVSVHQTKIWTDMLTHYGFRGECDFSTLSIFADHKNLNKENIRIAVAPGSQNNPAKRLPPCAWVEICKKILAVSSLRCASIELLGTKNDWSICQEIEMRLANQNIINYAGKTSITELHRRLSMSKILVCNDSGAMHLANMVGTIVVAIFNVTDPLKTGPVYNSKSFIIQSADQGTKLNDFSNVSDKVISAIELALS